MTASSTRSVRSAAATTGKLLALDPALLVFPAHDYKGRSHSTIGAAIETNPALWSSRCMRIGCAASSFCNSKTT